MNIKSIRKVFIVYIIMLSIMLLLKFNVSINYIMEKISSVKMSRELGAWNINLVPFKTISSQLSLLNHIPIIAIKNLAGNIIIFIPFGILLPMSFKCMAKYYKTFLVCIVYILIIELIQFISMLGSFDIDDIILNCVGVSCGYLLFIVVMKYKAHLPKL